MFPCASTHYLPVHILNEMYAWLKYMVVILFFYLNKVGNYVVALLLLYWINNSIVAVRFLHSLALYCFFLHCLSVNASFTKVDNYWYISNITKYGDFLRKQIVSIQRVLGTELFYFTLFEFFLCHLVKARKVGFSELSSP